MKEDPAPGMGAGRGWLVACAVGALFVAAAAGAVEPSERAQVEAEVSETLARFAGLLEAGDWQAAADFYADDPGFRWIEDGSVRYRSRDEVAEALSDLGAVFTEVEMRLGETAVVPLSREVAAVSTSFFQNLETAGGVSIEIAGAISAVMVRRGGVWRFVQGHTSTREAPPPGDSREPVRGGGA